VTSVGLVMQVITFETDPVSVQERGPVIPIVVRTQLPRSASMTTIVLHRESRDVNQNNDRDDA
jgi:hypothetical protein